MPWPDAGTATAAERGRREVLIILKSPEVTSREIKAGTGKSFLDLFCSVNGTTRSLEIVIFRHLAWRPERFQLQLKKGSLEWEPPTGRPPWAWCSKVQDASGASTIDAIEAAENSSPCDRLGNSRLSRRPNTQQCYKK